MNTLSSALYDNNHSFIIVKMKHVVGKLISICMTTGVLQMLYIVIVVLLQIKKVTTRKNGKPWLNVERKIKGTALLCYLKDYTCQNVKKNIIYYSTMCICVDNGRPK